MDKAEVYIKPKLSGWYKADLTVAVVTVLGVWCTFLGMAYPVALYVSIIALIAGIIVFLCRKHYSNDLTKSYRIAAGVIRRALYAIALSAFAVPFFMRAQSPFLYPVQRAIWCLNYEDRGESTMYFLPDNIPIMPVTIKLKWFPEFCSRLLISKSNFSQAPSSWRSTAVLLKAAVQ